LIHASIVSWGASIVSGEPARGARPLE
jgi:hypothetical protein